MATYAELTPKFRDENFRNLQHDEIFKKISMDLDKIAKHELSNEDLDNLAEIFRLLRNACISCRQNQEGIMAEDIPKLVVDLLCRHKLESEKSDKMRLCGLQFCGNFIADNTTTRHYLWTIAYPALFEYFICDCPSADEVNRIKITNVCCMVLYNCLLSDNVLSEIMDHPTGQRIAVSVCNQYLHTDTQHWHVLCIQEHFLWNTNFMPLVFEECSTSVQAKMLEILHSTLTEERELAPSWVKSTAIFLAEQLSKWLKDFFEGNENVTLLSLAIRNLCWLTASTTPFANSEGDNLLSDSINFLGDICSSPKAANQRDKIGMKPNTAQSTTRPTSQNVTQPDNITKNGTDSECVENEDANLSNSCLQRDLVRLIGNLCFQNTNMQNKVRDLGGIPLILESCNIDETNPFMQQWAVFAIRNLCENNPQNQAEIARLEKLGVADSPVLRDMGLTAMQEEDGKIRLVKTKN